MMQGFINLSEKSQGKDTNKLQKNQGEKMQADRKSRGKVCRK